MKEIKGNKEIKWGKKGKGNKDEREGNKAVEKKRMQ